MKLKGFLKIFFIIVTLFLLQGNVYAEDTYYFGQEELIESLPKEAEDKLNRLEIAPDDSISEISAENIFSEIFNVISESIPKPLTMLVSTAAVIVLCAIISAMKEGDELSETFNTVGVLACSGIICTSFASVIQSAKAAIDGFAAFLSVYIPTFAGIMAAGGQSGSAAAYSAVITAAVQVMSQIFSLIIFPLTSCMMGVSVAGAVNPELKISSIAELAKRLVNWGLTFIMTVFTGLLSVQSFVSLGGYCFHEGGEVYRIGSRSYSRRSGIRCFVCGKGKHRPYKSRNGRIRYYSVCGNNGSDTYICFALSYCIYSRGGRKRFFGDIKAYCAYKKCGKRNIRDNSGDCLFLAFSGYFYGDNAGYRFGAVKGLLK